MNPGVQEPMNARYPLLVLAFGAVVTTVATAQQNQYQQQIQSQLTRAAAAVKQQGYSADRQPMMGSLNDDADESVMIQLTGGVHYAIVGACDNDCTDVDLQLFTNEGNKLAEDLETDDKPVLEFTAPYTGQYRMKVLMPTCNTNPCYYGVQVFTK